jgi:hypothetical protein
VSKHVRRQKMPLAIWKVRKRSIGRTSECVARCIARRWQ